MKRADLYYVMVRPSNEGDFRPLVIDYGLTLEGAERAQARILEQVAISSSRASSQSRDRTCVSSLLDWQADSLPPCHLGSLDEY